MRTLIGFIAIVFAVGIGAPALARSPAGDNTASGDASKNLSKEEKAKLAEHLKMRKHIEKDMKYPATKEDILAKCSGMKEVKTDDKKWFEATLPAGTYNSAADVEKAIGWEPTAAGDADKPNGKKSK